MGDTGEEIGSRDAIKFRGDGCERSHVLKDHDRLFSAVAAALLLSCSLAKPDPTPTATTVSGCPVTIAPTRVTPPQGIAPGPGLYGNDYLWAAIPPSGVQSIVRRADGLLIVKYMWWRLVKGDLSVTGRRLDQDGPPAYAELADSGDFGFQASGVVFPSPGCWEVTGTVAGHPLVFVVLVHEKVLPTPSATTNQP